jgi:hypothetical protein
MAVDESAVDALGLLQDLTTRDLAVLVGIYMLCRDGQSRTPKDVAAKFSDASHQLITKHMYALVGIGAARWDNNGGSPTCRPTDAGVQAMRIHYRDWRSRFSEGDDAKVLAC